MVINIIFYDFEVFEYDWLVVLKNPEKQTTVKIHNDKDGLLKYYEENKNDIWCGYNSRGYDQFILKAILCGLPPIPPYRLQSWDSRFLRLLTERFPLLR